MKLPSVKITKTQGCFIASDQMRRTSVFKMVCKICIFSKYFLNNGKLFFKNITWNDFENEQVKLQLIIQKMECMQLWFKKWLLPSAYKTHHSPAYVLMHELNKLQYPFYKCNSISIGRISNEFVPVDRFFNEHLTLDCSEQQLPFEMRKFQVSVRESNLVSGSWSKPLQDQSNISRNETRMHKHTF